MWEVDGENIRMVEGDFGFYLPFTFDDINITAEDIVTLVIKKDKDSEPLLIKSFTDIVDNTVNLILTKEDSEKLVVDNYLYTLDWCNSDAFLGTLINGALFKVIEKK